MINNMDDLNKVLQPLIEKAMKLTEDAIFKVVSQKIVDYYNEPVFDNSLDPSESVYYNRTGRLLEELTASKIEKKGNQFSFTIGWDDDYLSFRYPGGFVKKHTSASYNKATGLQVLNWMNSSSHGGTVDGEHDFWDEALGELGNEAGILNIFKQNCKRVGIPIIN